MADSSIRIPWTWRDRITLASHAARHQLDKGTLATLHMDQLADRLGFGPYMSSGPYRDILVRKLSSALNYLLQRLHEQGHIIHKSTKPYNTTWKPHTRKWGDEGWDGNMDNPVSPDGNCTLNDDGLMCVDLNSHISTDNIWDATPPSTPSPRRFAPDPIPIPQLINPTRLPSSFQSNAAPRHRFEVPPETPPPTIGFMEKTETWLRTCQRPMRQQNRQPNLSDMFVARRNGRERRMPRPPPIAVPDHPAPRPARVPTQVSSTPNDTTEAQTAPDKALSTREVVAQFVQAAKLPNKTVHASAPAPTKPTTVTKQPSDNLAEMIRNISLLTAWLHFNKYSPAVEVQRRERRVELISLINKYPRSAFAAVAWQFSASTNT